MIEGESGGGADTLDFSADHGHHRQLAAPRRADRRAGLTLALVAGNTVENLTGGDGNDTLIGNAWDNILVAGTGNDILIGGGGSNVYVFPADPGHDLIFGTIGKALDPAPTIVVAGNVTLQAGDAPGLMEILAQNNNTVVFQDPGVLTIDARTP